MARDVVVLGATVSGLTSARILARRGFDVVVLDPNPEGSSAAVGHGVAAVGHASTVAAMDHAYGPEVVKEHLLRNVAGMAEIREICPSAVELPLRDRSLPGGDERETREAVRLFREAGGNAELLLTPAGAAVSSTALVIDPTSYAAALRAAAVSAGVQVVHGVTVTHLTRREGLTRVFFRTNLAWAREPGSLNGHAVVDTLGVSPWGSAARIGPEQYVPVVRGRLDVPLHEVSLEATSTAWLVRPIGDGGVLLLGPKCSFGGIESAAERLQEWAVTALGARELTRSQLTIDPSDHGRPVVGASAIPGGFYARGNGRGELMNGTASGHYLAGLIGKRSGAGAALPPVSQLRAYGIRRFRPK